MFRNILHTVATRAISTVLSFVLIILVTNFLGAQGKGEVSLFLLNLTILILFSNCVGGPAMVYSVPRLGFKRSLLPAYLWGLISILGIASLLLLSGLQEKTLFIHLVLIAIIDAIGSIHVNALVGKKEIAKGNLAQLAEVAVLLLVFGFLISSGHLNIMSYVYALYFGMAAKLLVGLPSILKEWKLDDFPKNSFINDFKFIFKYGFVGQLGNVAQLLNYRLAFYYLEYRTGLNGTIQVGIFSTALHIVEAMWLVSKSIATVQFAEISNMKDRAQAFFTTDRLHRLNLSLMALAMIPIVLIPSSFYEWIFGSGEGFDQVREILLWMIPGTIAIPLSTSLSHHFSGSGFPKYNLYASSLGLAFTGILGWYWIPEGGVIGAAQVSSIAYCMVYLCLLFIYLKDDDWRERRLLPRARDFKDFKSLVLHKLNAT